MLARYACGSDAHRLARREFLGTLAGGMVVGGLGTLTNPGAAAELTRQQMRVVVLNMHGGLSQLESWDPKPKTDTGGPFRAIPTSVPGIHISELLPATARHMDKLALVRGLNTRNGDHAKGQHQMERGRDAMPGMEFPHLGAVCAKALERQDNPLPGHIRIPSSGRGGNAAYLGPRYDSLGVQGAPPPNSARAETLTEEADAQRQDLRRHMNSRFSTQRRTAETDVYTQSYEQALQLMERRDVFDVSKEPDSEHERYGKYDLGRHCLAARRLLEHGVPFVQVTHSNYDTHNENFDFHMEQLGEFDRSFAALVEDIHQRGMLDTTLIVVMSEFGRTPRINARFGRDHWGTAWSVCLGGARTQRGAVVGKTNEKGTEVIDREVHHGDLFHTYLAAVGLDSSESFKLGGREVPMADPAHAPIRELLS